MVVCSLFFYAWGEPGHFLILVISIVANYCFGLLISRSAGKKSVARFWLVCALIFNLGILFVFKYMSFILKNIGYATGWKASIPNIALPIGISFFTFQAISYIVDIYRKDAPVQTNCLNLALYLSFFPKLTQGPIMTYRTFEPQMLERRETLKKFSSGVCFFIVGLGKKVLLANNVAIVANRIFSLNDMETLPVSLAWLGAIAYTFQIYFDFSGYSDMAIGLGLMFGFKLDQNFNYPYMSKSIREFWRRWHISLGMWFRDYLYFPLGGSRVANKDLIVRNLAIVWISTGVWHGANWTFLIWGILNFICIALERIFHFEESKVPNFIQHIYAMIVIIVGWVIFRSASLQAAGKYIGCMFNFVQNQFYSNYTVMFLKEFWIFFVAAIVFSLPLAPVLNQFMAKGIQLHINVTPQLFQEEHSIYRKVPYAKAISAVYPVAMLLLFFVCVTYLVKGCYNPFIYFQF